MTATETLQRKGFTVHQIVGSYRSRRTGQIGEFAIVDRNDSKFKICRVAGGQVSHDGPVTNTVEEAAKWVENELSSSRDIVRI